jgi:hypothetical protein
MRKALPGARDDAWARALRDLLADLMVTLPTLLERGLPGPVHAWFAGFDGLREALFPGLAAAYRAWQAGDGGAALRLAIADGRVHFEALAQRLLQQWQRDGEGAAPAIAQALKDEAAVCRIDQTGQTGQTGRMDTRRHA